tara:strand:- start:14 stop:466 length:453 start_codon:yes stop_codon:yes gene_type:complete
MEIAGYEDYLIYEDGGVYNKKYNRFLKPGSSRRYKNIGLYKNKKRKTFAIHRLVALHYIPNPENKLEVDHISRDKSNNHVSNLRWSTRLENQQNKGDVKHNTSGVKNVCYSKEKKMWRYRKIINELRHEKCFETFEEAVEYKKEYELTIS